ncbi:MAG TPA: DUF3108 domain-containing protein [Thermodesulfovibrionales bacterium]|nr:DUF3108 domain-containing protein [Thermodesulfovibrionales bacterium]
MFSLCRSGRGRETRHGTLRYSKSLIFTLISAHLFLHLLSAEAFPFVVPEILTYDLTWTGIKAGEASLEIRDEGNEMKIISTARSAKWLSVFYTVNDLVESRLSKGKPAMGQPVNYKIRLREGRNRKNKEVIFDYRNLKALSIDHLDKERAEVEIPAQVFDSLSSFYYVRTLNLEVGRSVFVTVFDNKKIWDIEVQVLRKERVEVPAGQFTTIVIKPLMKSEGIFYRKGDIFIWLTDDEKRIPVMLKTKVKVGTITARLVGGRY